MQLLADEKQATCKCFEYDAEAKRTAAQSALAVQTTLVPDATTPLESASPTESLGSTTATEPFGSAPPTEPLGSIPPTESPGSTTATEPLGLAPPTEPLGSAPPTEPFGSAPPTEPLGSAPPTEPFGSTIATEPTPFVSPHPPVPVKYTCHDKDGKHVIPLVVQLDRVRTWPGPVENKPIPQCAMTLGGLPLQGETRGASLAMVCPHLTLWDMCGQKYALAIRYVRGKEETTHHVTGVRALAFLSAVWSIFVQREDWDDALLSQHMMHPWVTDTSKSHKMHCMFHASSKPLQQSCIQPKAIPTWTTHSTKDEKALVAWLNPMDPVELQTPTGRVHLVSLGNEWFVHRLLPSRSLSLLSWNQVKRLFAPQAPYVWRSTWGACMGCGKWNKQTVECRRCHHGGHSCSVKCLVRAAKVHKPLCQTGAHADAVRQEGERRNECAEAVSQHHRRNMVRLCLTRDWSTSRVPFPLPVKEGDVLSFLGLPDDVAGITHEHVVQAHKQALLKNPSAKDLVDRAFRILTTPRLLQSVRAHGKLSMRPGKPMATMEPFESLAEEAKALLHPGRPHPKPIEPLTEAT